MVDPLAAAASAAFTAWGLGLLAVTFALATLARIHRGD